MVYKIPPGGGGKPYLASGLNGYMETKSKCKRYYGISLPLFVGVCVGVCTGGAGGVNSVSITELNHMH